MGTWAKLWSKIPLIISKSDRQAQAAIDNTLLRIETEAKGRSRWKTGNMRGGWTAEILGRHRGVVFNLVEYTIYHEYGTVNMSAQPMLAPAVAKYEPMLLDELKEIYS